MAHLLLCKKPMRMPRELESEGTYHLIARSNNGQMLCKYPRDYLALKKRILEYTKPVGIQILHYALMKTHLHLLAYIPQTNELASTMKAFQLSYFHYYRRHYDYQGHLWHSRYRSIAMENEARCLQCGRYIELNPVHAWIVDRPEKYRWCSYRFYAFGEKDALVTANPSVVGLGREFDRQEYQTFVSAGIDHDYQQLKKLRLEAL